MGTVIKAGGVGRIKKRLETLALKDHMAEAHRIVRDARAQSVRIIECAQEEVERRKRDAHRSGHEVGLAEGREAGLAAGHAEAYAAGRARFDAEQLELLSSLNALMSGFEKLKDELLDLARHDVLTLAVAVAERVTRRTASVDRQAAVENARTAIELVTNESDIVIRIHPVDGDLMRQYSAELAESFNQRRHVKLVEDESIGPGGCIVETPRIRIDATVEKQIQEAAAIILQDEQVIARPAGGKEPT